MPADFRRALFPNRCFRFYDGGAREKDILSKAYMRLIKHINLIYNVCLLNPKPNIFNTLYRYTSLMNGRKTT